MSDLGRIRLKTLGWFIALPVPVLALLPWWLNRRSDGPFHWEGSLW